jgi:aspartate aminotransferase
MLSISHRGQIMPTSPIRKLVPFAEAAQKKGIHVFHLNIGQPDIETPKQTLDAVRNSDFKILEYSHSAGNESYRKKLIGYYAKSDIYVTTDEIIITTGASEAILFGLMACMDPGDEIIIPEPFYANYKAYAVEVGVVVRPITSTIDKNFALGKARLAIKNSGTADSCNLSSRCLWGCPNNAIYNPIHSTFNKCSKFKNFRYFSRIGNCFGVK